MYPKYGNDEEKYFEMFNKGVLDECEAMKTLGDK